MITSTSDVVPTTTIVPTETERLEYRRRMIETADRSFVNDRLTVNLPAGIYGEWHGTDTMSQMIAQTKGFRDGSEYLTEFNKLHNNPEGTTVGDVKFMVIEAWKFEEQEAAARYESNRRAGVSSDMKSEEYKQSAKSIGLGVENENSSGRVISGTELQAHIPKRN